MPQRFRGGGLRVMIPWREKHRAPLSHSAVVGATDWCGSRRGGGQKQGTEIRATIKGSKRKVSRVL